MKSLKLIRQNNKYKMFKAVAKVRGRGSKFQWNSMGTYIIVESNYTGNTYTYKTKEEAEKAWMFLTLRDV